ncbi:MAG: hypothetical protein IJV56_09245 [Neisseriaceae bacterium]|nr:hypothetical protein [Neisseriaceae bacterium]
MKFNDYIIEIQVVINYSILVGWEAHPTIELNFCFCIGFASVFFRLPEPLWIMQ